MIKFSMFSIILLLQFALEFEYKYILLTEILFGFYVAYIHNKDKYLTSTFTFFTFVYMYVYLITLFVDDKYYQNYDYAVFLFNISYYFVVFGYLLKFKTNYFDINIKGFYLSHFNKILLFLFFLFLYLVNIQTLVAISFLQIFSFYLLSKYGIKSIVSIGLIVTVGYLSFMIGKVIVLRYFVFFVFYFIFIYKMKISLLKISLLSTVLVSIFGYFNYLRFLREGVIIDGSLINVVMKVLFAGNDFLYGINLMLNNKWIDYATFGSTYVAPLFKFFPREIFEMKPYGANGIFNFLINPEYTYNANTYATAIVGEAYMNFGLLLFIFFIFIGILLKQIDNVQLGNSMTISSTVLLAITYLSIFSIVRDDFNIGFGFFIFYFIFWYILFNNKQFKKA